MSFYLKFKGGSCVAKTDVCLVPACNKKNTNTNKILIVMIACVATGEGQ